MLREHCAYVCVAHRQAVSWGWGRGGIAATLTENHNIIVTSNILTGINRPLFQTTGVGMRGPPPQTTMPIPPTESHLGGGGEGQGAGWGEREGVLPDIPRKGGAGWMLGGGSGSWKRMGIKALNPCNVVRHSWDGVEHLHIITLEP